MDSMDVEDLHQNVAHRAVLRKVNDGGSQQLVDYDGLEDESHSEVLRILPHGMISNPPAGSEGIVVGLGTRDMPVFFGGEHPDKRPTGLPDSAAGFYDGSGLLVYGDGQGNVFVKGAKTLTAEIEGDCSIKAATITLEGAIKFKGDIEHTGNMTTSGLHTDAAGGHT